MKSYPLKNATKDCISCGREFRVRGRETQAHPGYWVCVPERGEPEECEDCCLEKEQERKEDWKS